MEGLDWSEAVVAVMDGSDPDSGTAWERGYAYARGKPIITFRSDFRKPGESHHLLQRDALGAPTPTWSSRCARSVELVAPSEAFVVLPEH